MVYSAILVDCFNLGYRKKGAKTDPIGICNAMIDYIEGELKNHLSTDGNIYLLFDPLPELLKNDLGLSKSFKIPTARQQIVSTYKAHRKHDDNVIQAVKLLRKYYAMRGKNYKICISRHLEADDFVEDITKLEEGNLALITNDSDWGRYISDRVDMISTTFDKPYTVSEYFAENKMRPTIASVSFKKAILGDPGDEIYGVKTIKKIVFGSDIDKITHEFLAYISVKQLTIDEILNKFEHYTLSKMYDIERDPIENLWYTLHTASSTNEDFPDEDPYKKVLFNLRVIRSRCDDVRKYIKCNDYDEKYCKLMDVLLKRVVQQKKAKFGNIKI